MISISIFHLVFFQDQMRELLVTDDFQKTKNHYSTLKYIIDHLFNVFKRKDFSMN